MKQSLGKNFCYFYFIFGRYVTNLRGTFVEIVKKLQNQPTLLYSLCDVYRHVHCTELQYTNSVSFC
jgi:hypothetical protein